jgi:hypothetical protein
MDPLSLTASITAVVTLATQVITSCYQYSSAVADAKNDAQRLAQEVATVSGLLAGLQNTILSVRSPQLEWLATTKETVGVLDETLKVLMGKLEKARPREAEGLNFDGMMKKMIWPFKKKGQEEVLARLDRQKASLTNLLLQGSV